MRTIGNILASLFIGFCVAFALAAVMGADPTNLTIYRFILFVVAGCCYAWLSTPEKKDQTHGK